MRAWWRRPSRLPRRPRMLAALMLAAGAVTLWSSGQASGASGTAVQGGAGQAAAKRAAATKTPDPPGPGARLVQLPTSATLVAEGQQLFDQSCSACHGLSLQGRAGIAPSLEGVGAGPVDFYLSTGRMPLANPRAEPIQETPAFDRRQIDAIVDYVVKVGGGPPAVTADPAAGSISTGFKLFDENCAGCHSIVARGGIVVGAQVPDLQQATAQQIAEAVRMGPYLMPKFSSAQLSQHDLDSIARYVIWTRHPDDPGGWGIYNIGPIPEGIVAWFMGLLALVIVARLIGERT